MIKRLTISLITITSIVLYVTVITPLTYWIFLGRNFEDDIKEVVDKLKNYG
jgi:hypothetical protein